MLKAIAILAAILILFAIPASQHQSHQFQVLEKSLA
jgi:membrane protein YdbS with pleckstrin-like domain